MCVVVAHLFDAFTVSDITLLTGAHLEGFFFCFLSCSGRSCRSFTEKFIGEEEERGMSQKINIYFFSLSLSLFALGVTLLVKPIKVC